MEYALTLHGKDQLLQYLRMTWTMLGICCRMLVFFERYLMLECSFSFFCVFGEEGRQGGTEGEYPKNREFF